MSKEAMKLALEHAQPSFAAPGWTLVRDEDITALREALAEQQEPVAWYDEEYDCAYTAAELDGGNVDGLLPLYTSPQPAPVAEPRKQEPVSCVLSQQEMAEAAKRYTSPPAQRQARSADTWVGLTRDERYEICRGSEDAWEACEATEAKLKEKNSDHGRQAETDRHPIVRSKGDGA